MRQELALELGGLAPVGRLGQRLEDLDIVLGLLGEELCQALVDLGHAVTGAVGGFPLASAAASVACRTNWKPLRTTFSAWPAALSLTCMPSAAISLRAFLVISASLSASVLAILATAVIPESE